MIKNRSFINIFLYFFFLGKTFIYCRFIYTYTSCKTPHYVRNLISLQFSTKKNDVKLELIMPLLKQISVTFNNMNRIFNHYFHTCPLRPVSYLLSFERYMYILYNQLSHIFAPVHFYNKNDIRILRETNQIAYFYQ